MRDRASADPFEQLLGLADRPAMPSRDFAEGLRDRLIAELSADEKSAKGNDSMSTMIVQAPVALGDYRRSKTQRKLMPILEVAAAILVIFGFVAALAGPDQVKDRFGISGPPPSTLHPTVAQQIATPPPTVIPPTVDPGMMASMYGGTSGRTGEQPGPGPLEEPGLAWMLEDMGGIIEPKLTALGGVLYAAGDFASVGEPADPFLEAIDLQTGEVLWKVKIDVLGGIAATADLLFVNVKEPVPGASPKPYLVAIGTADGEIDWKRQIPASPVGWIDSVSPIVIGDVVYTASADGGVYAFGATTGNQVWVSSGQRAANTGGESSDGPPPISGAGQFAVGDGYLFRVDLDGVLAAIDLKTGAEVWRLTIQDRIGLQPLNANVLVTGQAVALVVDCSDGKTAIALFETSTGLDLWKKELNGLVPNVAVSGSGLIVPLRPLEETAAGTKVERYSLLTGETLGTLPAVLGDVTGVSAVGQSAYLVDQDGSIAAWNVVTDKVDWVVAAGVGLYMPPIVSDGTIVVEGGADKVGLYAFNETGFASPEAGMQPTIAPPTSTPMMTPTPDVAASGNGDGAEATATVIPTAMPPTATPTPNVAVSGPGDGPTPTSAGN
jgi:outer membrane protein assembly factor BamB